MTMFIFLVFLWLLPSIIMMYSQDWNFESAVYFCFITISTIGLGDVTPAMSVDPLELDEDKPGDSFKQVTDLENFYFFMIYPVNIIRFWFVFETFITYNKVFVCLVI